MNPEELIAPGMYTDASSGDIWEKDDAGNWRVNGMPHKPFPVSLVPVQKTAPPAVSIYDAVRSNPDSAPYRYHPMDLRNRNAEKET